MILYLKNVKNNLQRVKRVQKLHLNFGLKFNSFVPYIS